jgi:hypothetical protein
VEDLLEKLIDLGYSAADDQGVGLDPSFWGQGEEFEMWELVFDDLGDVVEVAESFEDFYDVGSYSYFKNIDGVPSHRIIRPLLRANHIHNDLINLLQVQIIIKFFFVKTLTLLNGVRLSLQLVF